MPSPAVARRPTPARRVASIVVAVALALLVSLAGKHTLDRWLSSVPAILISHAAGLAVLVALVRRANGTARARS